MTFVGRILVILIMAFSLVFLGISVVTFTTAVNWKERSEKQKSDIGKLQGSVRDKEGLVKAAQDNLERAKAEHKAATDQLNTRVADLESQSTKAENDKTEAQKKLELAQQNARVSLEEATKYKTEIDALNETLGKAQTQANQFSAQNIELTDRIRVLEREKATAEQNAKDLRTFTAKLMAWARDKGLQINNINEFDPNSVPPSVEGKVTEIDPTNKSMEISIGSNDGLAVGQVFNVFRLQPRQRFLGKVKIVSVYPNKAVADVVGQTQNREKIQEGDIVSSTFSSDR